MERKQWRIRDIIDLEFFLSIDNKEERLSSYSSLSKRDRSLYLEYIKDEGTKDQSPDPHDVIKIWLEKRRSEEKEMQGMGRVPPGEAFDEIYRLIVFVMMIVGFFSGAGPAFSFLTYKGTEPVNVAAYLGVFVFSQILLILFLVTVFLIRILKKYPLRSSVIFILVSGFSNRMMYKIKGHSLNVLSGSQRDGLEAVAGLIGGKKQAYGRLFYWPAFISSQVFMASLNIGVLCSTILKVAFTDIAFGWQSTIALDPEFILSLSKALALPWSWFAPAEFAYPAIDQIRGSHMILKDGIYHLATKDLVSWWPFLCFSLIFYGLIPRIILLLCGLFLKAKALFRIDLIHGGCAKIYSRMTTPTLETDGNPIETKSVSDDFLNKREYSDALQSNRDIMALIPDEVYNDLPFEEISKAVIRKTGRKIIERIRLKQDVLSDEPIFDEYIQSNDKKNHDILLIQEAWQPPIKETMELLKNLRKAAGSSPRILVGLIGRPNPGDLFAQVQESDLTAWSKKIKALNDPNLFLERLEFNAR